MKGKKNKNKDRIPESMMKWRCLCGNPMSEGRLACQMCEWKRKSRRVSMILGGGGGTPRPT